MIALGGSCSVIQHLGLGQNAVAEIGAEEARGLKVDLVAQEFR